MKLNYPCYIGVTNMVQKTKEKLPNWLMKKFLPLTVEFHINEYIKSSQTK